ncbi:MAG TPA: hypothetical protein VM580_27645 [Labilithrix sp.]|nr:hypothetical protein [Labilithrix sp.]
MTRTCGRFLALSLAALTTLAACGGKEARAPVGTDDDRVRTPVRKNRPEPPVSGHLVAAVGERSLGPFFARRGSGLGAGGLVAWVTVAEGSGRRVLVVPIAPNGAPRGGETVAAHVSVDTTMLVVKPLGGPAPGFLLAWTSLTDRGKSLWSVAVGDDGVPRGKPVELTRSNDDIVWVDIVPTDRGALCLWAEETRDGDANLVSASIDTDGKVRGVPTRVARGIVGWHALEMPGGVGVSTIEAAAAPGSVRSSDRQLRDVRPGGALLFHRLDADGHAAAAPITVTNQPVVSGDIEVVRDGSRLVFAWTDRSSPEPSVAIAAIDEKNTVEPPRKFAEARGGASILALASGPAGVAVMFEAPTRRKGETRRVHVGRAGPNLALASRPVSLELLGRGKPELAATATGFAVLATIADCEQGSTGCLNAPAVTTLLRTDDKVTLVQREPLTFQADPATLGWGMTCEGDSCFALAASPTAHGTPSRIRTATIRPQVNVAPPQAKPAPPPKDGPHITDVTAIASGESVVDMAMTPIGTTKLVAMLTAPSGRKSAPNDAKTALFTLSTRIVDDTGASQPPAIISPRALHMGHIGIAAADKPEDGGAIAWVAREGGRSQVHVTRIDSRGRRTNDIQLTTAQGDATDVTIHWAGGGWIVAWIDSRSGRSEVYATKVSPELSRIAREERITNAPGDASDLVALARGDTVWLAWADSRESPNDGMADIFVSAVRTRDAKRVIENQRLLPTAAHSRSPHLADGPNGLHLAWIEEAPIGSETPAASGYGAFWTKLDASGKLTQKPAQIPLAGDGAATSVAIDASAHFRAVVARSTPDAIMLDAVDLSASPSRVAPLVTLDGPPSLDVVLFLEDDIVYFNDDGLNPADRRARRARIAWAPQKS